MPSRRHDDAVRLEDARWLAIVARPLCCHLRSLPSTLLWVALLCLADARREHVLAACRRVRIVAVAAAAGLRFRERRSIASSARTGVVHASSPLVAPRAGVARARHARSISRPSSPKADRAPHVHPALNNNKKEMNMWRAIALGSTAG